MPNFRDHFPIFKTHPELVYLDSAATSQKPTSVIEAVSSFYRTANANVHRGLYELSVQSTALYEQAREQVAHFIGATSSKEIVFTRNATEALNLLAFSLGKQVQSRDEVIISELEHHANLIPWQELAKQHQLKLHFVQISDRGEINLKNLQELLTPRTKIISLSHCSNVLGTVTPIAEVKKMLDEEGSSALLIVDAAQSVPHFPVSVAELGADFLVFSGHKVYAPSGIGVLWGRLKLLDSLPPYQTGGDMIKTVSKEAAAWNDLPWKFEAGTPNIEGAIGLAAALSFLQEIGLENIARHTTELAIQARERLEELPEVTILGDPNPLSGIISFTVAGIHPHDLAQMLGEEQICIRAGHHCAAPLHKVLELNASNRISLGLYSTTEDLDRFIRALKQIILNVSRV